jgi:hypothetical protein
MDGQTCITKIEECLYLGTEGVLPRVQSKFVPDSKSSETTADSGREIKIPVTCESSIARKDARMSRAVHSLSSLASTGKRKSVPASNPAGSGCSVRGIRKKEKLAPQDTP